MGCQNGNLYLEYNITPFRADTGDGLTIEKQAAFMYVSKASRPTRPFIFSYRPYSTIVLCNSSAYSHHTTVPDPRRKDC